MTDLMHAAGNEITADQLYNLLRLRVDVFVVEQECPYPELDGRDLLASTQHYWIPGEAGAQACLRVLAEPDGGSRIGRVCTAGTSRGTGLAARLMTAALADIGDNTGVLDAQTYAQGFYARFGFVAEGDEYLEDGIPHITMRRPAPVG